LKIIAVSGYKKSGKSVLCRKLLAGLAARGFNAGYVKRSSDEVGSPPDTDSGAARAMGFGTVVWGRDCLRYETPLKPEGDDPYEIAGKFFPEADVVILEGGKDLRLPKIWVLKEGETPPEGGGVFAVYDRFGPGDGASLFGESETERLADAIAEKIRNGFRSARVFIGDAEIPMKDFVADFVSGGVRGMLGALKKTGGVDESRRVRLYVK
jgi:molybdopterin-guanine dinucleotide biosynthesis protein B